MLLLAAAAWFCWWREPPAVASAPSLPLPLAGAVPATGAEAAPVRAAVPGPAAEQAIADEKLLVRGRCLAAESGQPLQVALQVGEDDGAAGELASADRAIATGTSGSDGRFELGVAFAGQKDLRLVATAADRAAMNCRRDGAQAGDVWDVGDVRLPLTARVSGEVIDATGEAVSGAQVMLVMIGLAPMTMTFRDQHTASSDARGRFVMTAPMAAGEWWLQVDGTGALRNPRKTHVPPGGEHFVRIEVERPDPAQAITGRVVDDKGLPLPDVSLSAHGEGARGRGRSGADGAFLLHRGPPHFDRGKSGVELTADAPLFEHVRPAEGQQAAWGQRDVVVVMQPLAAMTVRAIDERGARVVAFEVLHGRLSGTGPAWIDYAASKLQYAGSGARLSELRSGPHVLLLLPQDPALAVAGPVRFLAGDKEPGELVVRVPDRVPLSVEVVDTAGAPVRQCELDLLASLSEAPADTALPAPRLAGARSAQLRGSRQVSLASGTTDERGLAQFGAPPGRYTLHARCVTHLKHTSEVVVAASEPRLGIVLDAATVLRGRLVPADLLPVLGLAETRPDRRLAVLARVAGAGTPPARARTDVARAEVATDGTFTLGPLPRGVCALRLQGWLVCSEVHTGSMQYSLGELDAAGPQAVEREFDVAAFAPATVTGIVLLDGRPMQDAQFFLRRYDPEPRIHVRIATGTDGRFQTRMPPGVLGAQLAIPSQPGPGHVILPLPDRWTLRAGGTAELRVEGETRALRLVLRTGDDKPLGSRRVRVESKDGYNRPGVVTTDAEGVVEVTPAPYGEFTVHVMNDPGPELVSRPLQAPAGSPASLEVRLGG
ncbi:MAG TPA: carboxypeptidase-like regulatory domain-containing protein [Planctomycetota bacterium]